MNTPATTVWKFTDEAEQVHLCVPLLEVTVSGAVATLAVGDRDGLIVLRGESDRLAVAQDPEFVAAAQRAYQATLASDAEPTLVIEAPGGSGGNARFVADRALAHAGRSYVRARPLAGGDNAFFVAGPEGFDAVADPKLNARLAQRMSIPESGSPPEGFTLQLPGGSAVDVEVQHEVDVAGSHYCVGADVANAQTFYAVRRDGARSSVVTDPDELERVATALRDAS
ncbi:MAG: hypothetical protein ACYS22_15180 [Planctomycetota bacterium]|jgi:hypothetical protein